MLKIDFETRVGTFDLAPQFEASSEFVVLFGASGCGKSLTLQTIAGLLKPSAGRIVLPGGAVAFDASEGIDLPPQERSVGYVVQDLALFPHMNARDNITFGLMRWPKQRQAERVAHLVQLFDLGGLEERRPGQLSGGQQQRVALARALAAEPSLLLLDEPFSALDAPLRSILRREVAALRRGLDLTAVLVTHDLNEAYALADRIVVMDEGRVLQHGARADIFRRPASRRVAELTEARNIVQGNVVAFAEGVAVVQTPWFMARIRDPETPIRGGVYLCIRPEHVLLLREGREARHVDDVTLDAEIIDEIPSPHGHRLLMRVVPPDDGSGEAFIFEVDVPAHPYEVLDVAQRREWKILLLAEHLSVVPAG